MKKKLLSFSLATLVGVSGVIGGTYAYFSSTQTNSENKFTAGTLEVSSYRHDVPQIGPMFYTHDDIETGMMGTGYWKPGDTHTRALFVDNIGTLTAKLKNLIAVPEGTNTTDALAFAKQADITIAVYDPPSDSNYDTADYIKFTNQLQQDIYEKTYYKFFDDQAKRLSMTYEEYREIYFDIAADVTETLMNGIFEYNGSPIKVKSVYTGTLEDLYNNGNGVGPLLDVSIPRDQTAYFGYTVHLRESTPQVNNVIQGKEVKFSFKSTFGQ